MAYKKVRTEDNSATYFNEEFNENYHSTVGALTEALEKFITPSKLKERAGGKKVRLLDVPFGLGYNSLCSLDQTDNISITAIEYDVCPTSFLLEEEGIPKQWREILLSLKDKKAYKKGRASINLIIDDARHALKDTGLSFDLIFLDPFSPKKNPELWSLDFMRILYKILDENGLLITYSSAMPVLSALKRAGFFVGQTPAVGRKRGGCVASKNKSLIHNPLSPEEEYLITKSAGKIAYRDIGLKWDREKILSFRERARQKVLSLNVLESVKQAKKKLGIK